MRLLSCRLFLTIITATISSFTSFELFGQDSLKKSVTFLPLKSDYPTVDGRFHGLCRRWYSDGQLASSGYFIDGVQNGKWISYYENGELQSKTTFDRGYAKNYSRFDTNGIATIEMKTNLFAVKDISRNANGVKMYSSTYKHGVPVNCSSINKMNGKDTIFDLCTYKSIPVSDKNGIYFDNSRKKIPQIFKGKIEGWHENGKRKIRYFYRRGKLEGTWTEWDLEGNIVRQKVYRKGIFTHND